MRQLLFFFLFVLTACGRTDLEPLPLGEGGIVGDGGPVNEAGTCPMNQIRCGNACVDPNDPNNCGTCNNKCSATAACKMGVCTECPSGFSVCNGACVDLQGDAKNCGKCGTACTNGQVCAAGLCSTSCPIGRSKCGNDCVDVSKDPANCGGCGVACMGGQTCVNSMCCAMGSTVCGGKCVDTSSDPNNCGGCGTMCTNGQQCSSGSCLSCKKTVLVLTDNQTTANMALQGAIQSAGFTVTMGSVSQYNGSPAASGFGAVLVTNGTEWFNDMPNSGQSAITGAQASNGTGVVLTEWVAYEISTNKYQTLKSLLLSPRQSGDVQKMTFTQATNHPIWTGLPNSFTTVFAMGFNKSSMLQNGATMIASCSQCQNVGVAVKDGSGNTGRIVQIAHAGNFSTGGMAWSGDTNVTKMLTNAIGWAARCL